MKVYVRAPYEEACLAELKEIFDEVVYEPWTATGQRYYEDEMLEHLLTRRWKQMKEASLAEAEG